MISIKVFLGLFEAASGVIAGDGEKIINGLKTTGVGLATTAVTKAAGHIIGKGEGHEAADGDTHTDNGVDISDIGL